MSLLRLPTQAAGPLHDWGPLPAGAAAGAVKATALAAVQAVHGLPRILPSLAGHLYLAIRQQEVCERARVLWGDLQTSSC